MSSKEKTNRNSCLIMTRVKIVMEDYKQCEIVIEMLEQIFFLYELSTSISYLCHHKEFRAYTPKKI